MDNHHVLFSVVDRSYTAVIKKEIHALAGKCAFKANEMAEIDIVVAELISNLLKYAVNGRLLVKTCIDAKEAGLEIIAIDDGPGIPDLSLAQVDGITTHKKSLGMGLGAIKRLTSVFQVFSKVGWGTIILVRKYVGSSNEVARKLKMTLGAVIVPKPGEQVCGDGLYTRLDHQGARIFMADGLGHGKEAALAAIQAITAFADNRDDNAINILRTLHQTSSVRKTRGLVGTVLLINLRSGIIKINGIGNISSRLIFRGVIRNFLSYNGIIGLNIPSSMNEQSFDVEKGQLLIMCSDGIRTRWDLSKLPGIAKHDPNIIAAAIYKDFCRNTDDASVLVVKIM
ncbi:SpoIIE family protein phosphatase [Deminuibacter soli]|uniref:Serine/threonine protein kinase n=1 Tax=Deminuibacter soli TaxID=2291815 RepID=A0A3E1NFY2_9BACT|nr:SpoIIE family protein phosphatase [Deminuibacter soli]RFM26873.1 serine/threonine protein kinase [Deminuibacter soli]